MKMKEFILLSVILLLCNECYNLSDFSHYKNKSVFNVSDVYLNSELLIKKYQYPFENHYVTTKDGYVLNVYRIPSQGPPVLLVHGIADSSDSWLVLGPENSLAFLLADVGFDVWLINSRGNKYSKKNVKSTPKEKFWRFTFEEIGTKDLPATIDYVLNKTREEKLTYIGFSQGTTSFLVLCSLIPEYNAKIKNSILLAPIAWVNNMKHPFIETVALNFHKLSYLVNKFQFYEVFSSNRVQNKYHAYVCKQESLSNILCVLEYFLSYGLSNSSHISKNKFPIVASHIPAGTSSFSFLHYIQNYILKRFQSFNYYIESNWSTNQYLRKLPEYDLSKVSAPITLFVSDSDWFTDKKDVNKLKRSLKSIVGYHLISARDFSHLEFVYGSRAKKLVYTKLFEILSMFN